MSVQRSGLFHVQRLATWLMHDPEGLCTINNEIWVEKIHFDFSQEGHFVEANCSEKYFVND